MDFVSFFLEDVLWAEEEEDFDRKRYDLRQDAKKPPEDLPTPPLLCALVGIPAGAEGGPVNDMLMGDNDKPPTLRREERFPTVK